MAETTEIQLYRPSCGSEGADFMENWCGRCERDRLFREGVGDSCLIAANTMAYDLSSPAYPKEWRRDGPIGPRCTAFEGDRGPDPAAAIGKLL